MGKRPSGPAALCCFRLSYSLVILVVVIEMGGIKKKRRTVRGKVQDPIALILTKLLQI